MTTTVGHWKRDADCDVYVGRPSPFGNPFKIGRDGTRQQVLAKYEEHLFKHPKLVARARKELKGKKLGCFCKPKACHAEILAKYIDTYFEPLDKVAAKILVTGDREWTDKEKIERELKTFPRGTILVHGGCRGVDRLAGEVGKQLGFIVRRYSAKWKTEGKLAGPLRNMRMLQHEHPDNDGKKIDLVIAFHPDLTKSKGARDMVNKARLAGIEVKLVAPAPVAVAPRALPAPDFIVCPSCGLNLSVGFWKSGGCLGCGHILGASLVVPEKVGTKTEEQSIKAPAPQVPPKSLPVYDPRANGALCDECPCNGRPVVPPAPPEGDVQAIFVGMNPGSEEERRRVPFVGQSGKFFDRMLTKFDLDRSKFHVTNAWLCRHRNDDEQLKASKCCAPRLQKEIEGYAKSIPVVTMGKEAFQSAFGKKAPITKSRGFQWMKDGREFYPTLHPAFVLRDKVQLPLISRDFRRVAKRIVLGHLPLDEPNYDYVKHTPRTLKQLRELLKLFGDGPVACDIETSREAPTVAKLECIGISNGEHTIVIPWDKQFGKSLRQFFKNRETIFHNGYAFDTIVLSRKGIVVRRVQDTLIAHHVFASHFRQGLDHLASFYLDTIPWKRLYGVESGDEKGTAKDRDEKEFYKYNSHDSYNSFLIWQRMQEDLKDWHQLYEQDKKLAIICRHMTRSGVRVDLAKRDGLIDAIAKKEERLVAQMREACGREFGPTKTNEIRDIIFNQFKAPVLERTEKEGLPSTSKKILQAFGATEGRPYSNFCKWLVEWRACTKMKMTYLVNLKIEKDERVRPGWKSFGAYTGRFSCSKPNLMNLKRFNKRFRNEPEQHIRSIYIPSEGCRFVTYDMSQVEPRVAAYISGDQAFIDAVEKGDFHTNNAIVLFGELPELLDLMRAKEGDGKPMRDTAKSCGLAVNYLAEAPTLKDFLATQEYFLPLSKCQEMIDKLRKKYHVYFKFVAGNVALAQKQGWLKIGTLSGRIRWLGFNPSPSSVADTPIQSTAADIMNDRLIAIYDALLESGYFKKGVKIVAQIHDAVIFDVPIPLVEEIKQLIRDKMSKKFKIGDRERSFPIDMKEGDRWSAL